MNKYMGYLAVIFRKHCIFWRKPFPLKLVESPATNAYKVAATSHVTKKTYRKVKYIAGYTNYNYTEI